MSAAFPLPKKAQHFNMTIKSHMIQTHSLALGDKGLINLIVKQKE